MNVLGREALRVLSPGILTACVAHSYARFSGRPHTLRLGRKKRGFCPSLSSARRTNRHARSRPNPGVVNHSVARMLRGDAQRAYSTHVSRLRVVQSRVVCSIPRGTTLRRRGLRRRSSGAFDRTARNPQEPPTVLPDETASDLRGAILGARAPHPCKSRNFCTTFSSNE